jgi:hypothetical protein
MTLPNDVLVLMPCGGNKLSTRAPLLDLYTGPLWQTLRTHLGEIPARNVFVLSAKLGLRSVLEQADPYEQRMSSQRAQQLVRQGIHGCDTIVRNNMVVPMGPTPMSQLVSGRSDTISKIERPFRAVILAGAGDYLWVMHGLLLDMQIADLVTPDAEILTVQGGIGEQRGQLGAHLRRFQPAALAA